MTVDVITEVSIALPVPEVAAFAANPDNAPAWYVNIKSIEWKSEPPLRAGTRVAFVAQFFGRRLAYTYEVLEFVPERILRMSTAEGPFPMETTYRWQADNQGGTRMTLRNRGDPTGFSRLIAPFMAAAIRRANRQDLVRLKSLLETSGGDRSASPSIDSSRSPFYFDRPPACADNFRCNWLVGMTEKSNGNVRLGCGAYEWAFQRQSGLASRLIVTIEAMQSLPSTEFAPVFDWLGKLSYAWCSVADALALASAIESLGPVLRYLANDRDPAAHADTRRCDAQFIRPGGKIGSRDRRREGRWQGNRALPGGQRGQGAGLGCHRGGDRRRRGGAGRHHAKGADRRGPVTLAGRCAHRHPRQ
jgi:hypothetical protein